MTTNKKRLQFWAQLSIWSILILLSTLFFSRFMPIAGSLSRSFGNVVPVMLLFYGNMWLVARFFIPKKYLAYLFWCGLLMLIVTGIRTHFNLRFVDYELDFLPQTNREFLRMAALVSNLGIFLVSTIYQLLIHQNDEEKKALLAANEHQQAQLQFLRSQINPHFLFNTLNNIYSLAVTGSKKTAPMVLQLSELLRYVVYEGQAEKVALEKEVQQIKRFIELFQMRQEKPVQIQFTTEIIPSDLKIEPMILIPLVENCFKHCDFDTNPNAQTRIHVTVAARELLFHTYNTKDDNDLQKDTSGGVGLQNIQKRLKLKYPSQHSIHIEQQVDSFDVQLQIKL